MTRPQSRRARHVAYVNARLMDPSTGLDAPGAVLTDGRSIADVGPDLFAEGVPEHVEETVDCKGLVLCPGLVDMRVQLGEPGNEHKETLKTASAAAVAGGVTSMVCLPNTNPVIDDAAGVEFIARRARQIALTKVYCYAAATRGLAGEQLSEMGLLAEAGARGVTDGVKAITDAQTMRRVLTYASTFEIPVIQHPEEPALADGVMTEGALATRLGLPGIPRAAESIMIARDVRLAELTGGRLHVAHVSTAEGLDIIRRARERGVRVTCDTAPPYFVLNEHAIGEYRTFAKLSPPLRPDEDRQAVIEGLRDGTIDAIASDHSPQDQDSKRLPFAHAAFGGAGLETLLATALHLYHNGDMGLMEVISRMTVAPAALLDLPAGRLRRGAPADLLIFDPDKPWKVVGDDLKSKSKNTPFDGHLMQGLAWRTVVDGRVAFRLE